MPSSPNPALVWDDGSPRTPENCPGYHRIVAADRALEDAGYGPVYSHIDVEPEEHDRIIAIYKGERPITDADRVRLELLSLFANADRIRIPVQGSYFVNARASYREELRKEGKSARWITAMEQDDAEQSVRVLLRNILKTQ